MKTKKNQKVSAVSCKTLLDKIQKWVTAVCASVTTALVFAMPASAAKINTKLDTETMVGGIVEFVIEVAKWMGFVVVAAGIFMFVFAYKDDNAEQQSRAARFAVVGALLIGLESILEITGLISK